MIWLSLHRGLYTLHRALKVEKNCYMSGEMGNITPVPFVPMVPVREMTASFAFLGGGFLYKPLWEA